ncbi:MAG: energy transducer TonB [Bacteroidota bacterium]
MFKFLLLFLLTCTCTFLDAQRLYYDCNFENIISNSNEGTNNYIEFYYKGDTTTYKYYNSKNLHLKTETFVNLNGLKKVKYGPAIIYNYDGSVYSEELYINGKRNGTSILYNRDNTLTKSLYAFDQILCKTNLTASSDTIIQTVYHPTIKNKITQIRYFKDNKLDSVKNFPATFSDSFPNQTKGNLDAPFINEKMPEFKKDLMKFLNENISFPDYEKYGSICCTINVRFVIMEDGSVTKVVVSGPKLYPELEQYAINLIEKTNLLWIPGSQNNRPIRTETMMPITFSNID